MPAGGSWGTFNPYTFQNQRSRGRGYGSQTYRGQPNYRQTRGGYYNPPTPGWQPGGGGGGGGYPRPGGGGGYPQSATRNRTPQRYGGGGGGGIGGGNVGRPGFLGNRANMIDPNTGRVRTQGQRTMANYGMPEPMISLMSNPFASTEFMNQMGMPQQFQQYGAPEYMQLMMMGMAPPGMPPGMGGGY